MKKRRVTLTPTCENIFAMISVPWEEGCSPSRVTQPTNIVLVHRNRGSNVNGVYGNRVDIGGGSSITQSDCRRQT